MIKDKLLNTICNAIVDKKGEDVVILDISDLEGTICDYFVVCTATSTVQCGAIADNVEKETFEKLREKVIRVQGQENALWIAMDYGNVIVHIFLDELRDYYNIEELWADAKITKFEE